MEKESLFKDKFTFDDGILKYEGKEISDYSDTYLFSNYYIKELLGSGRSAVTFRACNKFLEIDQVIKIYNPDIPQDKVKKEIQKNSHTKLHSINAVNHEGGEIISPFKTCYAIMENIDGFVTIREWLKNRDDFYATYKSEFPDGYDRIENNIYQQSLSMAATFLKSVQFLISNNIVHGDLNPGNIMVLNSFESKETMLKHYSDNDNNSTLYSTNSITSRVELGFLHDIPLKFIDMGTSQWGGTTKDIGIDRDCVKIYDTVKRILKPFFNEQHTFKKALYFSDNGKNQIILKKRSRYLLIFKKPNRRQSVLSSLVRLVLFLNYSYGLISNSEGNPIDIFPTNIADSLSALYADSRALNVFMMDNFVEYLDWRLVSPTLVNELAEAGRARCAILINWQNIWQQLIFLFPAAKLDRYKITDHSMMAYVNPPTIEQPSHRSLENAPNEYFLDNTEIDDNTL